MFLCRFISWVVEKGVLLWPEGSLNKTVSLCPASFCTPRPNLPLFQVSLYFLHLLSNPTWWKAQLFLVLVLEVLQVFIELVNFSFFSISGWGIYSNYCDAEWFTLEMNWDHSVIFEITRKDSISESFVNDEDYSISSKGFLPTVVDIMVIWIGYSINFHLFVDIQLLKITYIWKIISIDVFLESGILFGIWFLFKHWRVFILTNMGKTR